MQLVECSIQRPRMVVQCARQRRSPIASTSRPAPLCYRGRYPARYSTAQHRAATPRPTSTLPAVLTRLPDRTRNDSSSTTSTANTNTQHTHSPPPTLHIHPHAPLPLASTHSTPTYTTAQAKEPSISAASSRLPPPTASVTNPRLRLQRASSAPPVSLPEPCRPALSGLHSTAGRGPYRLADRCLTLLGADVCTCTKPGRAAAFRVREGHLCSVLQGALHRAEQSTDCSAHHTFQALYWLQHSVSDTWRS